MTSVKEPIIYTINSLKNKKKIIFSYIQEVFVESHFA